MTDPVDDTRPVTEAPGTETETYESPEVRPKNKLWLAILIGLAILALVFLALLLFDSPDAEPPVADEVTPAPADVAPAAYDPAVDMDNIGDAAAVPAGVTVRGQGEVAVAAMLNQIDTMNGDPVQLDGIAVNRVMTGGFTIGQGSAETLVVLDQGTAPVEPGDLVSITGFARDAGALEVVDGMDPALIDRAKGYIAANRIARASE